MEDFERIQREYTDRLKRALEIAVERLAIEGLSLTVITVDALRTFEEEWQGHLDRKRQWDWTGEDHRPPKGLNVAMWHGTTLCGLASGKLTSGAARIDFIEGFPGDHPLKGWVIPIALTVAAAYARLNKRDELRVYDVDPQLIPVCEKHGLEVAPDGGKVHVMRRKLI